MTTPNGDDTRNDAIKPNRIKPNRSSRYRSKLVPENPYGLTAEELHIIKELAAAGERQFELAARLNKHPGTINGHLWNIYAKMGVHNEAAAAVKWIREQEIPPLLSRWPSLQ